jgi:hypothetical protein
MEPMLCFTELSYFVPYDLPCSAMGACLARPYLLER